MEWFVYKFKSRLTWFISLIWVKICCAFLDYRYFDWYLYLKIGYFIQNSLNDLPLLVRYCNSTSWFIKKLQKFLNSSENSPLTTAKHSKNCNAQMFLEKLYWLRNKQLFENLLHVVRVCKTTYVMLIITLIM